jgi:hypothetical protein
LRGANLSGANLIDVVLNNADLRGADFRNAVLIDANLTDVLIDDADFSGALIVNVTATQTNTQAAIGFSSMSPPATGQIGANISELERLALKSGAFATAAIIDLLDHEVLLSVSLDGKSGKISTECHPTPQFSVTKTANTISSAMVDVTQKWTSGKLRIDSISVKGLKGCGTATELKRLAIAAWCEACAVPALDKNQVKAQVASRKDDIDRLRDKSWTNGAPISLPKAGTKSIASEPAS